MSEKLKKNSNSVQNIIELKANTMKHKNAELVWFHYQLKVKI